MTTETKKTGRNFFLGFISLIIVVLLATLPFHYIFYQDDFYIVPKENLTFHNTFFTYYDVESLLKRYNESSFMEKAAISNESIFKRLEEKGIIVDKKGYED